MKKYIIIPVSMLLSIALHSCNNNENKSDLKEISAKTDTSKEYNFDWADKFLQSNCSNPEGIGNFLISHSLADSMKNHFDSIYRKDDSRRDINAFLKNYWLSSCAIIDISSYLRKNSDKFDGIRINFGCSAINDYNSYPNQQYTNKTTFFIIPTVHSANGHKDSTQAMIPLPSCPNGCEFIKPYSEVSTKIAVFDKVYRKYNLSSRIALKDSLSKGIWLDSCVISFIADLLLKFPTILDGVNLVTGAYFGNEPKVPNGLFRKNQSTIIIVPSNIITHSDNWDIIEAFMSSKRVSGTGLNHGQLCPEICD